MRLELAIVVLAALAPLPAQAMSVAEVLAKAAALKAKGMGALFAPELKQLRAEIQSVSNAYRADLAAQRAAGRPPHSCPPAKGKAKFDSDEFLGELRSIPPAERQTTSFKQAFYRMMKRKYPCS